VIRETLHDRVGLDQPAQRPRELEARRHEHREVIQAGRAAHPRRRFARRQHEKIPPAGAKPRGSIVAAVQREPEVGFVKTDRAAEIRNRQMDRADARLRIDRLRHVRL